MTRRVSNWGLLAAVLIGVSLNAQTRTMITGVVTDDNGARLPGVALTLSSPEMVGGSRQTTTDGTGAYRFPELPPGTYAISASLARFATLESTGIQAPFGVTLTIDLTMHLGSVAQSVSVAATSPTIDVKSSAAPVRLGGELLDELPTNRTASTFLFNLAPGVVGDVAFGAAQGTTGFMLDGVPSTGAKFGNSVMSRVSVSWLEEMQVVSLGAPAEHGGFTGASANMIVRSGGNDFHGMADYGVTRNSWLADNRGSLTPALQAQFRPVEIASLWDTRVQAGGRIIKDRLFYFTGFEFIKDEKVPAGALGGATNDQRHPKMISKISWAATSGTRVEGTFSYDNLKRTGSEASATRAPESLTDRVSPNYRWGFRLTQNLGTKSVLEVRQSGAWNNSADNPISPLTRLSPAPRRDLITGISTTNAPEFSTERIERNLTGANWSRYAGRHDLKAGFEFEMTRSVTEGGYPGGRSYQDQNGVPFQVVLWNGSIAEGTGKRSTFYVQDQWRVNQHLTIQPGVRMSINRGSVPNRGRVFSTTPILPRIGAAWDFTKSHRTVARFHYGRYDDPLLTGMFDFMDTARQTPTITARVLADGSFQELSRVTPATNFAIDRNLTHNYVDQFVAGIERELFSDYSVQAQYIRRNFRGFLGFVDSGSIYQPVQRPDPGPDNTLGNADDGGMITVYNLMNPGNAFLRLTNPEGAYRDYNGLQFVVRKRESHGFQFQASYTHSKTTGSVSNEQGTNVTTGTTDTSRTGVFANPNRAINNTGLVTYDYPNQFRVDGTYRVRLFGGFLVSGIYNASTGHAWGRRATIRNLNQGTETVRIEPRGTRRNEGINQLDLRVSKFFRIRERATVQAYADLFNVNNQGAPIRLFGTLGITDAAGARFGQPVEWTAPRTLRLGARFVF